MLSLPTKGLHSTETDYRLDLAVICDWIEGNILFEENGEFSNTDLVDNLAENELVPNQETAWVVVGDAWRELQRRAEWLGNGWALRLEGDRLTQRCTWRDSLAHAFCLALSFARWYPDWARQFGKDFTEQGELFELLTQECLRRLLPGWEVHVTGWSRTHPQRLNDIVNDVARRLLDPVLDLRPWTKKSAKDEGLDIVCYFLLPDSRPNFPVYLFQCASGGDWESKRYVPDTEIWRKLIDFTVVPRKAFSMPYALLDDEFRRHGATVQGLFLDRYRLLLPARDDPNWIPEELSNRIIAWLEPRVAGLPVANA